MLTIGLTGGFGTGKTIVAKMFKKLGARVLDADNVAHQLMNRNGTCFKTIVKEFGNEILSHGQINRKKLGDIVFKKSRTLKKLTDIIHPKVRQNFILKIKQYKTGGRTKIIIMDVPLLFESNFHTLCDYTIVVKADKSKQIKRIRMDISLGSVSKIILSFG